MRLLEPRTALVAAEVQLPAPGEHEVLVEVSACGVCRTDLHVVDAELEQPALPLIPGHEVVGRVVARGASAQRFALGARVGVPWLGWTCGACSFCLGGHENLCERARFTGYTLDGGYARQMLVDERYCFALDGDEDDAHLAPLLCAGLIGYRSLRLAGDAERVGLYGFGAAAHIVAQVAIHQGRRVYAFVRPGDVAAQRFAESLGVHWAGASDARPPEPLDAAILYAPVGALVPAALDVVRPGGSVVCAGIHMSDIPTFPYRLLWRERCVRSVANLTRCDGEEFFALTRTLSLQTSIVEYELADANRALSDLRTGKVNGAAVLRPRS
ncbi:MAG TPA: zinc-dependent alcohol dehydrogenase family protein [Polyangiaceae bacterium]|nr:zinc-dependent alcohol dehydrogenase family protein [Polyangiaceae bacterium]